MNVPSFSDLGKSARDVFRTGYHYGKSLIKLTGRKTGGNFEMGSDLSLNCDEMKLTGTADAEYKTADYGSFLEKWTTDGTVVIGYFFSRTPIPDTGLRTEISYNPGTAAKAMKIGANCNKQNFNALCSISSDKNMNVDILGSLVTAFKGITVGYQGGYSTEMNKLTKNDVGVAFSYRDVGFHFRCTSIPIEYGLSLLYKVNAFWDAAIDGILATNGNAQEWTLGAAAKCKIDDTSTFRFKFNTDFQLGMSLQQKLDDSVTVSLSCNIDCANVTRGGHKVGFGVEINA